MDKRGKRRRIILLLAAVAGVALSPLAWFGWVQWRYGRQIYSAEEVQPERVAVVFGARIYADGRLSAMLNDRVETAVQLYHAGQVRKLLLSGDNRFEDYDEPGRMMDYAISRGVPAEDIQPDFGGRRTYDTCYRAREIFGLESAILVTQDFHLPRALFICQALGMEVMGVSADRRTYSRRSIAWSTIREIPATLAALWDVIRREPAPVMGDPILIE
jgi:SanA protein